MSWNFPRTRHVPSQTASPGGTEMRDRLRHQFEIMANTWEHIPNICKHGAGSPKDTSNMRLIAEFSSPRSMTSSSLKKLHVVDFASRNGTKPGRCNRSRTHASFSKCDFVGVTVEVVSLRRNLRSGLGTSTPLASTAATCHASAAGPFRY